MSNFAFGTYRISDYNPQHIQALRDAISSGIRMIDTSSNYMDGGAQRAIALAFSSFDESVKDTVEIVSKVGYIQGSNMDRHKEEPFEEVVEFSPDCFHSISASFIKDQLTESLKRLEMQRIDCYLLHNPEYYLLDAINRGIAKDEMQSEMYGRIYRAFVALEQEVKDGRILSYGISSNSFSKNSSSAEFLPYEDLITLADRASEEVSNETHSFKTVQLPINILEQEGLKCAKWAKENGLRVLANRPLNAEFEGKMYRLADYDESREYYHHLNELLDICDNEQLKPLYNLFEELDASKHKFGWIGDWDAFFFAEIIPHMRTSLQSLDEESRELLVNSIDMFFVEYKKMVLHECSINTRKALKEIFKNDDVSMQDVALKFLMAQESIDYILVGMRKPSYILEILTLKD
ncbi:oxidoreductase [Sulfurimonas hongkongensis]|uniref:Oxidoreductase n=1 Tax=Sulfurimonas hongkongensis TaxID=1172190 RepID=T0JQZ4_9BACT|nr:aldo/keto reductase [Sulfurimonas hongkongensis]EQB39252.1 oxidoreductase [Sulfurimonas hongkongensis]